MEIVFAVVKDDPWLLPAHSALASSRFRVAMGSNTSPGAPKKTVRSVGVASFRAQESGGWNCCLLERHSAGRPVLRRPGGSVQRLGGEKTTQAQDLERSLMHVRSDRFSHEVFNEEEALQIRTQGIC